MKTILLALVALHCVRAFAAETPALPTKHTTRNLEGWSVLDISRRMGRTEAAVAGLLRRGLKRLRELLGEAPREES